MKDDFLESIADQVLDLHPDHSKDEWGRAFLDIAADHDPEAFEQWARAKLTASASRYVSDRKRAREAKRQAERLITRGVAVATGRPISPTMSIVADDGSRQQVLWVEASPTQFINAVMREQAIVNGRADSNATRLQVVEYLRSDDNLMSLPTLRDVCAALEIDPDALGLDELEEGAA